MLSAGSEFESLWREYEEGATKEAQLVKDFDKVPTSTCFRDLLLKDLSYPCGTTDTLVTSGEKRTGRVHHF